jgi:hypothetical protein
VISPQKAEWVVTEISFEVDGLPPAKSGMGSALGATSKQRPKVVALLEAAREAVLGSGFPGFGKRRLRLEVVLYARPDEAWDATNYLGGISDVLEGKAKRLIAHPGSLDHLEDLSQVGLYDDDRQIKEISHREVPSDTNSYVVTLSALE